MAALKDDGFIDFYELLGVEPDATVTRIRTTINLLYNEAQANRDHRNLNRRREYQTLLQLLPQAREFLLQEKMRERYDQFRDEVQRGVTAISFEDWTRGLKEEEEAAKGDRTAVLGVQDEESDGVPRATVVKAPRQPKAVSRVTIGADMPAARPRGSSARQSLIGSAASVIVFFILLVLCKALTGDLTISLLVGSIAGLIVWVATHRKTASRTRVQ
jgi:curved DNA-binding protein CbpA